MRRPESNMYIGVYVYYFARFCLSVELTAHDAAATCLLTVPNEQSSMFLTE